MLIKKLLSINILFLIFVNTSSLYAADANVMPSSGTCSFLINQPVPFGLDPSLLPYTTGGSAIGTITFTSGTAGNFYGAIVSPLYKSSGSPDVRAVDNEYMNGTFTVVPMTAPLGFVGGYRMFFNANITDYSGTVRVKSFEVNVVPSNSGKTILMQLANTNFTDPDAGVGPGTGVCNF